MTDVLQMADGTQLAQAGVFLFVLYPHRKTPDMYMAFEGHPIRCLQCDADLDGLEAFLEHVPVHNRRRRKR